MPETLRLDRQHRYWLGAEEILGTSFILADNGLVDSSWFTEEARSRGTVVHQVLAGIHSGYTFNWDDLHEKLHGFVRSGLAFRDRMKYEVLDVEQMRWHPIYRFAGTLDLRIRMNDYEYILDWKTGKAAKATRYQLAAYDLLAGPPKTFKFRKKICVELREDGGMPSIVEYNDPMYLHDDLSFLAFLETTRKRMEIKPNGHDHAGA